MDSFCSLFDPSDGQSKKKTWPDQDNVKKKLDTPKSRRRGRKAQGKNETLPEESSFLCEPALSSELLVKDGSYLDSYVEIKNDPKADDKKPKRRNSGRKNRRRKKVSPAKDEEDDTTAWNNQTAAASAGGGAVAAVGRHVNDLGDYRRRGKEMHNVIDKLEQVTLKDDTYLSGEFGADELRDEAWCSSDREESQDDSASSGSDSGTEAHGSLPPEPRFGNVEYKLQLVAPCERRFQHLVTQLKWRLRSGGGAAVYLLGVRDCGALRGLRARALRASLHTLRRMAGALRADLAHVSARRVAPHRAVAEVYIRKLADTQQSELRVAVMGANEAGKSTLIGVLTQGELDNGRGSARLNMFRHLHEVKSGRTSSLSHEILGFDAQGNVVNYGCSELMTAERIGERSAKLVSFLDLAGHSKYQRTTLHGLTGYCPHYAMLVISATAGITRITEEHIGLLLALALPFFCVVSKCELAAAPPLLARLADILAPHNKKPLLISDENSARHCVRPQRLLLDTIDGVDDVDAEDDQTEVEQIPVFPVSCVRGLGLSALHAYLLALEPPQEPHAQPDTNDNALEPPPEPHAQPDTNDNDTVEFQIDEIFHVGDSAGPVVGGLLARGQLAEGDSLIIGPLDTGEFVDVTVRSIYRNRVPCGGVRAGQSASLGLSRGIQPRPGMVLLCPPEARQDYKNGNIYRDIATAESSLAKQTYSRDNLYVSDAEDGDRAWSAGGEVLLEDPNDPRGCMYFQATVHVLRHSTAIARGFQCTAHVGNVRQTAIIEGIMSHDGALRCGQTAPALFRFLRQPEFLVRGRRLLLAAGQGTRAIGRVTQIFPYVP